MLRAPSPQARNAFIVFGTLSFAVHPLAIESVTYITGRSSSLATTFVLLSMAAYLRAALLARDPAVEARLARRHRWGNRILGGGLAAAALASLPAAWLQAQGIIDVGQAVRGAGGGTAVLLVVGAVARGRERSDERDDPTEVADRARAAGRWYTFAFVTFVLGTLTKEIAAVLPGILLLVEVVARDGSWRRGLATLKGRLFPFFAIPAFLILLRVAAYGYIAAPEPIRPWDVNLLTQLEVVAEYLRMWAWPLPQSVHHDHAVVALPGTVRTWVAGGLIAALLGGGLLGIRRAPSPAFGVLLMLGALAPTSSVFALKETMVEHRTYLPSIGFAFVVGGLAAGLPRLLGGRRRLAAALVGAWLVALGVLHVRYDRLWMSEEGLWRRAVAVNPDSSDAWRYLGDFYVQKQRWSSAEEALRESIRSRSSNIEAHNKLGHVLGVLGNLDEAESHFRAALAVDSCFAPALNNLATIRRLRSDVSGAVELFTDALACDASSYTGHRGLADIYYIHLQNRDKAAHHYSMALERIDPLSPAAAEIKNRLMELSW
jgi:hypothetical protein